LAGYATPIEPKNEAHDVAGYLQVLAQVRSDCVAKVVDTPSRHTSAELLFRRSADRLHSAGRPRQVWVLGFLPSSRAACHGEEQLAISRRKSPPHDREGFGGKWYHVSSSRLRASLEATGDRPARLPTIEVLKLRAFHAEDHVSAHPSQEQKPRRIGVVWVMVLNILEWAP
jgi:hypothetical protein